MKLVSLPLSYALLGIAAAVILILWQLLLPGYILTLDMVWVPHIEPHWSANAFNNAVPVWFAISLLSSIFPSWVIQKVLMVLTLFLILFIPYRFLPLVRDSRARLFSAALYALNPFVYARFLAGQWLVLLGYAMLPFFFFSLFELVRAPTRKAGLRFSLSLFLVGLFSVHYLYLCLLVTIVWICCAMVRSYSTSDRPRAKTLLTYSTLACVLFLLVSSYWIIPALLRHTRAEASFGSVQFAAFAAAPNGNVPAWLNTLALGGFWAEGTLWNFYFLWPQSTPLFWAAAILLALMVFVGVWRGSLWRERRAEVLGICIIGMLAFVTALGASDTPLRAFNLFLYAHLPLWSGLRDSNKIVGVLALTYVVLAGIGCEYLLERLRSRSYADVLLPALFVLPIAFGLYEWGGFHKQLQPTWYPAAWYAAKERVNALPANERVLVLPWHGYLSLDFTNEVVVANPANLFFGDRAVAGRSVDAGDVHDQETDPSYRALDNVLASTSTPDKQLLLSTLSEEHISYVLLLRNSLQSATPVWSDALALRSATSSALRAYFFGNEQLTDGDVVLIHINTDP